MAQITFGTDGWRALIADTFTFDNVRLVTKAIGQYLDTAYPKDRPVLVGHDTRFLAPAFAEEAAKLLAADGRPVMMPESFVATPVIAQAAKDENTAGALMFTASHNPPNYLGIKYIPDYAGPATSEITDAIVTNVRALQAHGMPAIGEPKAPITRFDPKPKYVAAIKARLDLEKLAAFDKPVACDPLYATAIGYMDVLLKALIKGPVTTIHDHRDVLFGGGMPEPSAKGLAELGEVVRSEGCALGLANDGDADRFGVLDDQGVYYTPNQIIALLARHLVKNRGQHGAIVRTVATTHLLDRLAAKYGVPLVETPVGFKHVGSAMRAQPVLIGGEESGGLSVLGHIPEKDGILANLLVVEMLAYEQKPLSAIWSELIAEVGGCPANVRLDLRLSEAAKARLLERLAAEPPAQVGDLAVREIKRIDGTKLLLANEAWMLVRPSGTEPLVRVYLEAGNADALEHLSQAAAQLVARLAGETPVAAHH